VPVQLTHLDFVFVPVPESPNVIEQTCSVELVGSLIAPVKSCWLKWLMVFAVEGGPAFARLMAPGVEKPMIEYSTPLRGEAARFSATT